MKNTGMIRKIDDLGRIVIPKEIRATFGLRTGSSLEISVRDGVEIVLTSHDTTKTLSQIAQLFCEAMSIINIDNIVITDSTKIIATSNMSTKYMHMTISKDLQHTIMSYDAIHNDTNTKLLLLDDGDELLTWAPIMDGVMCVGVVAQIKQSSVADNTVVKLIATLLSKELGD